MALQPSDGWFQVSGGAIVGDPDTPLPRPTAFGDDSPDSLLAAEGWYRLWIDDPGAPPHQYHDYVKGAVTVNGPQTRCERVDTWVQWDVPRTRDEKNREIDVQVPQFNATETFEDPGKDGDITRTSSAATDKRRELQDTPDQDVYAFDTTLDVADQQDGFDYSRITFNIEYVDPWVGQPSNNIGWVARLNIREGQESTGAEARVQIIDAPADTGAVIPFTQDATDPTLWTAEARDGFKWADENLPATMQLLWAAGSLPVSSKITCERLHDRQAELVRYGTPTS